MAVVYEAEDAVLGRPVALKTLRERYAEEESFRLRFKQEARAMASLDHENIVKVYDISQDDEVPFIVAECVNGRDVGGMLKQATGGRLEEGEVREISAQLLRALSYAHRRGVIHSDIKPSNILTTEEGRVKVADFGIARIVESEESAGEPGEIIGSARYMSPEQLRGEETTPRSDVYSVGILLYHCLTGRPPFSGDPKTVARRHASETPTPPRKLNKKISARMEAVILKALSKNPENRYPSASAMLDDIEANSRADGPTRADFKPRREKRGGRRALLVLATLALVFVGAGTAAASLGYVDMRALTAALPGQGAEQEQAVAPADPVERAPLEAPAAPEETAAAVPEATTTQQAQAFVPVPAMDSYFDYYARDVMRSQGLRPEIVREYREGYAPTGVVWATDPAPGTPVPEGSTVTVYATPQDQEQVPEVVLPDVSSN
jgi:tRNA A-37 threonylcarbamoyl transferase component Bud32